MPAETVRRRRYGHVELLSLTTPFLQLIDAEARGSTEERVTVVPTEVDSSLWDVRAVDERVLREPRHHCPGATD
ncbi:hypothetical protein ACFY0B_07080 [Streptomyces sp. NPDC001797]|uniref:hypothetical protein n=1 Tax=Streptomyces sp. NPDC001797 TaxID=3364610 RepID=UPI0036CF1E66